MKKSSSTPIADSYLEIASHLPETETDTFFYTRLKGRMEHVVGGDKHWSFSLKPVLLVGILMVLLFVNGFLFLSQGKTHTEISGTSSIQTFASSYDLTISTPY